MPAILGLRGAGDFTANERPQNWREMILFLFPNGEAPLTGLMSMLKAQGTDDPDYNWWEKRLPVQRMIVTNGPYAAGINANITVQASATNPGLQGGAKDIVKGTIVMDETTFELLRIDADPVSDTNIPQVTRGYGAIAAQIINTGDALVVVGNVHDEGSKAPTAKAYAPVKVTNFCQIFRMPLYLTRTARRTRLRWDNTGPYREAKREALQLHSIEMEKAFLWGNPVEITGYNGKPQRMTGGVLNFILTNKGSSAGGSAGTTATFNVNGPLDEDTLDVLCENIFRFGTNEKLCLAGSTFLRAITTLGKRNGTLNLVPTDHVYGMKVIEYVTAYGSLMLKNHPLLSQHPVWRQNAVILDPGNLVYRDLDDTMFIKNRQDNDEDASMDEFMTESGLELHFEETHAYIENVTGALIQ